VRKILLKLRMEQLTTKNSPPGMVATGVAKRE
jgi:hypothetical protein